MQVVYTYCEDCESTEEGVFKKCSECQSENVEYVRDEI
jgi:primosomal protein N'